MPKFELMPVTEAEIKSTTGKRAEIIREYVGYIDQLQVGQAGKLSVLEGETSGAVRRRLGSAAKMSGKELVIRRVGDEIYFWARPKAKRPGRPRKVHL